MYSEKGAAIGAGAVNLIGGLWGASKANQGYNEYIEQLNKSIAARRDHRDKVMFEDPTQAAENQAAVTQTKELLDAKIQATQDKNIVTGGTDEAVALDKQAAAATVGNMQQQQAAAGQQRKDRVWSEDQAEMEKFQKYKADAQLARKLNNAQNIVNIAHASAQAQMDAGKAMPW